MISILWPLCCFLLQSTWYSRFMRNKTSHFLPLPEKLSRNIKDSLTAVMTRLILEWHSDVSRPLMNSHSLVLLYDGWNSAGIIMRSTSDLQHDEMLIISTVFYISSSFTVEIPRPRCPVYQPKNIDYWLLTILVVKSRKAAVEQSDICTELIRTFDRSCV